MGCLLLEKPLAVCRMGLAAEALRVSLAMLFQLSRVESQEVTRMGCVEFTRPMLPQISPCGGGLTTGNVAPACRLHEVGSTKR